jgi:hypothetical protein
MIASKGFNGISLGCGVGNVTAQTQQQGTPQPASFYHPIAILLSHAARHSDGDRFHAEALSREATATRVVRVDFSLSARSR